MAADDETGQEIENVPCPFCALLCDDLGVVQRDGRIEVASNGCERSRRLFPFSDVVVAPTRAGMEVDAQAAMSAAGEILRSARRPLFISSGADVAGVRAMVELAERTGGSIDHVDSPSALRNLRVLQEKGWVATTLAEVRNRADLLVLAGCDIAGRLPRFFERCFGPAPSLFDREARSVWSIGTHGFAVYGDMPVRHLAADNARLAEIFSAMSALLADRKLDSRSVAGIDIRHLAELVASMKAARYGVLAWSAADLAFAHAELAVQAMAELVRALNFETRFAVLPLAGPRADVTATQVTMWQAGVPLPLDFRDDAPASRASGMRAEPDAIVHVAPLATAEALPAPGVPLVVLGHAGAASWKADAFIPVATPGIHHAGHYFRTDAVVALRMRKLTDRALPSAADVLQRLSAAIGSRP